MRRAVAMLLMAVSGFTGLAYQIVWTQQAAAWLGHEAGAVLAVLTAFFGGLALGAFLLGPLAARSTHPARWYAGCELAIGLWALVLGMVAQPAAHAVGELLGEHPSALVQWGATFLAVFVGLLPATAAMGATLPVMARLCAQWRPDAGSVAALYAANTAGAVLGVVAAVAWLVPVFGLARAAQWCALCNLLVAAVAPWLSRTRMPLEQPLAGRPLRPPLTLFVTGFLGLGYEVVLVRVLSQLSEDTVYTYASLLGVYLAGTAAGAAACRRRGAVGPSQWLVMLSLACLAGALVLAEAPRLRDAIEGLLGPGLAPAIATEALLAAAAFALPTFCMGALFSRLCEQAVQKGHGLARALGWNTLGAALAPVVFGVTALPLLGAKSCLIAIAVTYLALAWPSEKPRRAVRLAAAAVVVLGLLLPPFRYVDMPPGGRLVEYREGVLGAVSVVEDAEGVLRLRINNRQQEGSSATLRVDARQALLPLLLHPAPKRALFLGLGTGVTAAAAAASGLEVEAVELLPEVVAVSRRFTDPLLEAQPGAQLRVVAGDAVRVLRHGSRKFDVIVADNYHPARSGSGVLYSIEHFRAVGARLAAGGLFCQWLPLHQLDLDTLRIIVRSFLLVFPQGKAVLANSGLLTPVLGLVAGGPVEQLDPRAIATRRDGFAYPRPLADFGFEDDFAVLGSFVAGPRGLAQFAGAAPLNSEDRPLVTYRAPVATYAPAEAPGERLVELIGLLGAPAAADLLSGIAAPERNRWERYWQARDAFLAAGLRIQPGASPDELLAQVQEPLLAVLALCPDFRPAYDPLVQMAGRLAGDDPEAARALLQRIVSLQPARTEAHQLLARLETAASPASQDERAQ